MNAMPDTFPMFPLSFTGLSEYAAMRKPDFIPSYHTGNPPWANRKGRQDSRAAKGGKPRPQKRH